MQRHRRDTRQRTADGGRRQPAWSRLRIAVSAGLLSLLAGCGVLRPDCRRAWQEQERQQTLAEMASPGGIDRMALAESQRRRRNACGW